MRVWFSRVLSGLAVSTIVLFAACSDEAASPSALTPTPDIGPKQTEAAIPTVTPVSPAPTCTVAEAACELASVVSAEVQAGDIEALIARARPAVRTCPDVAPVRYLCEKQGTAQVSGFTYVVYGKVIDFVVEDEFVALIRQDFATLSGDVGVISIGCSGTVEGEAGSCEEFATLALGDRNDRDNAAVHLLFFTRAAGEWKLVGSARWAPFDAAVAGGPKAIWVADRGEAREIWFNPLQ